MGISRSDADPANAVAMFVLEHCSTPGKQAASYNLDFLSPEAVSADLCFQKSIHSGLYMVIQSRYSLLPFSHYLT